MDEYLRTNIPHIFAGGDVIGGQAVGGSAVHLTPLYQWYRGDFEQVAGTVLDYAAKIVEPLQADLQAGRRPQITWLEYDWSPNDQQHLP